MEAESYYLLHALSAALVTSLLIVVPLWRIFRHAGFHPAWALLVFVPYVGLFAALFMLAFTRWPADPMPREVA